MENDMRNSVRQLALLVVGAVAIASAIGSWSGSGAPRVVKARLSAAKISETVARTTVAPHPALPDGFLDQQTLQCGGGSCEVGSVVDACPPCFDVTDGSDVQPVSFDQSPGRFNAILSAYAPNPLLLASFEQNTATAAPASEISTAAMIALGIVMLTLRRGRRRIGGASWKAPWRLPQPRPI
jgi:hypothetical protein